ncbi:MAG: hypothetical protein A2017_14245 [Lentisphaerae bacterium GWF2_44_16]|nr:MAG: hypothetical protein A2017_14245 [Lentisphaerae bacterium GWF2_44_16]
MRKFLTFTLIELLIVISIIAILAAMLLPALKKARDSVKTISCLNRQKQTGLAVQSYMSDFSSYFHSPSDSNMVKWTNCLINNDYIKNGDILCCPSMTGFDRYSKTANGWYTYGAIYTIDASACISMKSGIYVQTTKAYIFGCSWCVSVQKPSFRMYPINDTSESYGRPYLIHNNKVNMYFLDGHAESRTKQSLPGIVGAAPVRYAVEASGSCYINVQ